MDTVQMPRELTADNGAKKLLIGEFFVEVELHNLDYCGCGECDYCIDYPDETEVKVHKFPVPWTTIKEIYRKVVGYYEHGPDIPKA